MFDNCVLVDYFFDCVKEVEVDVIFDGEEVYVMGIMEYIEFVGVYFGDFVVVLFIYSFLVEVVNKMVEIMEKLVKVFNILGLINIQFVIKDD